MLGSKSKQMALLEVHVHSVTHALCITSFSTKQMFRTKTGPRLSKVKNGRKSLSLSGI